LQEHAESLGDLDDVDAIVKRLGESSEEGGRGEESGSGEDGGEDFTFTQMLLAQSELKERQDEVQRQRQVISDTEKELRDFEIAQKRRMEESQAYAEGLRDKLKRAKEILSANEKRVRSWVDVFAERVLKYQQRLKSEGSAAASGSAAKAKFQSLRPDTGTPQQRLRITLQQLLRR
jgi:hypothetical protein